MEKPGRYQDVCFTRTWEDTPIPTSAPASWGFKKHLRGNKQAAVPTEQLGAGQINKILIYVGILFSCLAGGADPLQGVSSLSTTAHLFLRHPHGPAQGNTCSKSCACAVKLIKDQSAMSNCKLECLSPPKALHNSGLLCKHMAPGAWPSCFSSCTALSSPHFIYRLCHCTSLYLPSMPAHCTSGPLHMLFMLPGTPVLHFFTYLSSSPSWLP